LQVPRSLPRLIQLPPESGSGAHDFVLLSNLVQAHIAEVFGGMHVTSCAPFRLTQLTNGSHPSHHSLMM
jgi:polyphosphate kinase